MVKTAMGELTVEDFVTRRIDALTAEKRKEYSEGHGGGLDSGGQQVGRDKVYMDKGEKVPTEGCLQARRTPT